MDSMAEATHIVGLGMVHSDQSHEPTEATTATSAAPVAPAPAAVADAPATQQDTPESPLEASETTGAMRNLTLVTSNSDSTGTDGAAAVAGAATTGPALPLALPPTTVAVTSGKEGTDSSHSSPGAPSHASSLGARSSVEMERDRARAASEDDRSPLLDAHSAPAALLPTEGAFSPPPNGATLAVGSAVPYFPRQTAGGETAGPAAAAPTNAAADRPAAPVPAASASATATSAASTNASSSTPAAGAAAASPSTPPSLPSDSSFPIWIGSWNMGAKEMSVPLVATSASVSARAGVAAPTPVPSGAASPFNAWIPPGYKLYVVGLQESVSETTYRALDVFFSQKHMDCTRLLFPLHQTHSGSSGGGGNGGSGGGAETGVTGTVKVEGRGDGSFIYPKSTSIAAWVHRSARTLVTPCACGALSLGITQGSKGGAALALRVLDSTMVFVSVHLSSTTVAARRACYQALVESVGNALGESYFQLLEQFHHVFFLGDANFRLTGIGAPEAVKFMQRGDVAGLLRYDELTAELGNKDATSSERCFVGFREAPIDFWPTYKKHEGRRAQAGPGSTGAQTQGQGAQAQGQGAQTPGSIYWVHEVYKTIYKEPSVGGDDHGACGAA